MNFIVSGATGYIGSYFCETAKRAGHLIVEHPAQATHGLHLEWQHLPKYASPVHYNNVVPRIETLIEWRRHGLQNIIIVGSCLETVPHPPHYGRAKLLLLEEAQKMDINLQWVRLFNVYGGEREHPSRLVPRLRAAVEKNEDGFAVIDGIRDFLHVRTVAAQLIRIAEHGRAEIIELGSERPTSVVDFCRSIMPERFIHIETGFPMPEYEPYEMVPMKWDYRCCYAV